MSAECGVCGHTVHTGTCGAFMRVPSATSTDDMTTFTCDCAVCVYPGIRQYKTPATPLPQAFDPSKTLVEILQRMDEMSDDIRRAALPKMSDVELTATLAEINALSATPAFNFASRDTPLQNSKQVAAKAYAILSEPGA